MNGWGTLLTCLLCGLIGWFLAQAKYLRDIEQLYMKRNQEDIERSARILRSDQARLRDMTERLMSDDREDN